LRPRGLLHHQEQILHDYPFCWRAEEDPLIQYPRRSWFIRTTQFKERMVENNRKIDWLPQHIRDGRFGNFLGSNVDWALSRERYWGTPLPIWVCEATGYQEAIASYDELLAKPGVDGTEVWERARQAKPELPEDLKVHKPYIDAITYDSPRQRGARMRRVPEVIDCWFDSGSMPFAQWGYPHQGRDQFAAQFPADFISEAIDQTRGWFYSLLAISTLLFDEGDADDPDRSQAERPHPFRHCVVLGLMLGEDGAKMSKSKRNYREPNEIFDRYGADALRWYFFANQPPWTAIRYSEQAIKESIPEFLLTLWNVYSFFVIYANIDRFAPGDRMSAETDRGGEKQLGHDELARCEGYRLPIDRPELDRWILSELNQTAAAVTQCMDAYDNYGACQRLNAFVDGLSNWYVRRSRDRFWSGDRASADKLDAYFTLYECLLTTTKLISPFVPHLAESLWQNLGRNAVGEQVVESVHLCDFPTGDAQMVDSDLSERMGLVREITSLGRSARMGARLKVRQPLARVEVILASRQHQGWLADHAELIQDELNVKQVEFADDAQQYIRYTVVPNFKRLGPRLGRQMPAVKKLLAEADGGVLLKQLEADGKVTLNLPDGAVSLDTDDIEVRMTAREGWAAAQGNHAVVVLATQLDEALILEGLAREAIRVIQDRRKEVDCQYTDRIEIGLVTDSEQLRGAIEKFQAMIGSETLAVAIGFKPIDGVEPVERNVAGDTVGLYLRVAADAS
ncbi:MAG: class I tRNA ligase family protein, partial [Pirellulales bacterium]